MFSRTVEYALRAVVYLGSQAPGARTTEQIADATKVPQAYLSKVIQALNRSGILRSQRGIGGGISLGRDADQLTIYDVVSAVEPWERIQSCPLGIATHGSALCPLHRRMDRAAELVEEALRATTIAEVISEPSGAAPFCEFPACRPAD